MYKILKRLFQFLLSLQIGIILYLNYSLYYQPQFHQTNGTYYNQSVYQQLKHLQQALKNGAGDDMQQLFPEGFLFIHALYGLSWVNFIAHLPTSSTPYQEGIIALNEVNQTLTSAKAKQIFDPNLPLAYGAFYTGWTNYVLGKALSVQAITERKAGDIARFQSTCEKITNALTHSPSPYLETYKGQAWPADMLLGIASLQLHDQLFAPKYKTIITIWLDRVKQRLAEQTGLIPHSVYAQNGSVKESPRGSSQSLMLHFLYDIDREFALAQFELFKTHFLDWRLGLEAIREYPKGQYGSGDVDSGPVLWGIGGAACIVGQRTMAKYGDWDRYTRIRNCLEGIGFPLTNQSGKKYVFGQMPMADAFICWSNSIEQQPNQAKANGYWQWTFQLLSIMLIMMLLCLFYL